ncbi:helix-turn-helix transcriptional regulator [Cysteiniphilum marinum]|uniref:helix-turn-helix transcriptional regulator n=1 Tax=Cysteiniphilum marinum TaxID=2774191 RepID=UPI001939C4A1|nr:helix-turn-helix transcriptional regulator [Cysteiniphilum marinum]
MIIPNNHSSLKYDKMVKLVCRNLFAKTPISFFNFARFYKSGYVLNLSTNNEWHKHYWKCNYITGAKSRLIKGINYWAGNNLMSDAAIDADKNFNISGRIEFIENYKDHIDSFSYGCPTKEKEKIINYYLNNIIELKNFNLYFLSEMQNIISIIEKNEDFLKLPFIPECISSTKESLFLENKSKKILIPDSDNKHLTIHQFKVLAFKIRGYSNEDTAKFIGSSVENIKTHLKNIRKIITVNSNEGFIEKCVNIGLYDLSFSIYKQSIQDYFLFGDK